MSDASGEFLPTQYQQFIHLSRYSKFLWAERRRETWPETVGRYFDFFAQHLSNDHDFTLDDSIRAELENAVLHLRVMPSMRALMTAGPALARSHVAGYNCSFISIDRPHAFDEVLYVLMNGTGVGFSAESQFIEKLPMIAESFRLIDETIYVEDSKEGWAYAFRTLIEHLYKGEIPSWDVSQVRPAGAPLKVFGGRASGPEPLVNLFEFAVELFQKAAGRKLTSLECHDLVCKVAEIVVVGGVRRSALISLSDLTDPEMRTAKSGEWWVKNVHRALANNSAAYEKKPAWETFQAEWQALIDSGSGERGIFNREAATKQAIKWGRRDSNHKFGTNPCVTSDTWVLTENGPRQVSDLVGTPFEAIVNGKSYPSSGFWQTGHKPVYRLTTKHGYSLNLTSDHKVLTKNRGWIEASALIETDKIVIGDNRGLRWGEARNTDYSVGWLLGEVVGNGGYHPAKYAAYARFWGDTRDDMCERALEIARGLPYDHHRPTGLFGSKNSTHATTQVQTRAMDAAFEGLIEEATKKILPDLEKRSSAFIAGFLSGYFDADGTVLDNIAKGRSIRLSSVDLDKLFAVQRMLARLGIVSKIYQNRKAAGLNELPDGRGGKKHYFTQEVHELVISKDNMTRFANTIGFGESKKAEKLLGSLDKNSRGEYKDKFTTSLKSFEYIGEMDVFDCTVDEIHSFDANGIIVHNCSEIVLRPEEFCNLSEVVIRADDTLETLKKKVEIASILGTFQSTLTNFKYINDQWRRNCQEERLLGVSLTGIMDHEVMSGTKGYILLHAWLDVLHEVAVQTNAVWAAKLGINPSVAITCGKPSGCRPRTALTTTDKGLLTLEELMIDHTQVDQWSSVNRDIKVVQDGVPRAITKTYKNGISPVYRITMSYGLCVESTGNHSWWVKERIGFGNDHRHFPVDAWVTTKDLRINDVLDIKLGNYDRQEHSQLMQAPTPTHRGNVSIRQPIYMTEELAWLLGFLWGNGTLSASKWRVRFISQYKNIIEKCQTILMDAFDLYANIKPASEGRDAWTIDVGSHQLWDWLHINGFSKYDFDRLAFIPQAVRSSARGDIVAFIAGFLDADGCVSVDGDRRRVTVTTADGRFAQHLQDVGWSIGLGFGRSHNTRGKSFQAAKNMWLCTLGGWVTDEAFATLERNSEKIKASLPTFAFTHQRKSQRRHLPGKILGIELIGNMETYDIEVAGEPWFRAGAVKSHNTVSQLVDAASGIHARYDRFYIRRVRADKKDPLAKMMADLGFPVEDDITKPDHTCIFAFPVAAPPHAVLRHEIDAINQLKLWLAYKTHWCEHSQSVTIYVKPEEWEPVGRFVYDHFDEISGVSFLPFSDHVYQQAPYEEITEEQYHNLAAKMPSDVDWSLLARYEHTDMTESAQTLACVAGGCEI